MNILTHDHPHRHISRLLAIVACLLIFLAILPLSIRAELFRGLLEHRILTGMLLVLGLIALSFIWTTGQKIDAWTFLLFNLKGMRPPWLDRIMLGFTQLGSGITGMIAAIVLFIVDNHRLAYELVLGTLTLWSVVELVKALFNRSRPFVRLIEARIVGARERGLSFPSGHTSQIFFMATLLSRHFHLGFGPVLFVYGIAVWVGITRMYVGAHYPRDVLAGGILGSIWGSLGAIVDAHFRL